jgi:hypothetical protein
MKEDDPNKSPSQHTIVIEGVTKEGEKFRPSDWAERMSGTLATFKHRRIAYSPMLQPSVTQTGNKCVLLDKSLKQSNPELYNSILQFAKLNNLTICDDQETDDDRQA